MVTNEAIPPGRRARRKMPSTPAPREPSSIAAVSAARASACGFRCSSAPTALGNYHCPHLFPDQFEPPDNRQVR